MAEFPFNRDELDLPDEFHPPEEQAPSVEDFITLSLKLVARDIGCSFGWWQDLEGKEVNDDETQSALMHITAHLDQLRLGASMILEKTIALLTPENRLELARQKAEAVHGVAFKIDKLYDGNGNFIGGALKPVDPDSEIEGITQWLHDQS